MNIALIGYGKMGKAIEAIALGRGHHIALIVDVDNQHDLTPESLSNADVAINFSVPHSAVDNILACFAANVPIVSGTTGWLDRWEEITKLCIEKNQGLFYASNYSLGVNLFFALNKYVAKLMNPFPGYKVGITEVHHTQKLDAPSGTAITIAEGILRHLQRKNSFVLEPADKADNQIGITAIREGAVPGIHTVRYEDEIDYIEITHSAKSREGLAMGAVLAAEFMVGKKGIFGMEHLIQLHEA